MSYRRVGDDPLHPCESGEEPLRWYHYTVIPLVALLFPFRLAILVASLLLSATVCAMCCVGCEPNSDGSYELSGTRRAILLLLGRAIGRIVLLCFGVCARRVRTCARAVRTLSTCRAARRAGAARGARRARPARVGRRHGAARRPRRGHLLHL